MPFQCIIFEQKFQITDSDIIRNNRFLNIPFIVSMMNFDMLYSSVQQYIKEKDVIFH